MAKQNISLAKHNQVIAGYKSHFTRVANENRQLKQRKTKLEQVLKGKGWKQNDFSRAYQEIKAK